MDIKPLIDPAVVNYSTDSDYYDTDVEKESVPRSKNSIGSYGLGLTVFFVFFSHVVIY